MVTTIIYKELKKYIENNVDLYKEYQNKYFLKKKIKEILPNKSDEFIYRAIDKANCNKNKQSKKEFILILLDELNKYTTNSFQL